MGIIRIQVSIGLIVETITTGNEVSHHVVTRGLPKDAKIVCVALFPDQDLINLDFETESVPDGDIVNGTIEITKLSDVVRRN